VSAIFISYTGRDDDGKPIAEQVAVWLREWGYESFFRDQELIEGIPAGRDWRQLLHARLAQCEVGAFYWTVLAPDIVNLGREEQG
jgi:hypothetical protein